MPTLNEIWKPVKGYEGIYEVSNKGRVKSLPRNLKNCLGNYHKYIGKLLSPRHRKNDYLNVCLTIGGKEKNALIHRIVGIAFIPNPKNYKFINHIDFDPSNNNDWNLEWCTRKQNSEHSSSHGRMRHGENHPKHKLTLKQVEEIRLNSKKLKGAQQAILYGVSKNQIYVIKRKENWK